MSTLIIVVHVIICLAVIGLVLLQDSKGGAMGSAWGGGGGANSVFGPMGAATLAQKVTRVFAILFAISCIVLTVYFKKDNTSVIDKLPVDTTTSSSATDSNKSATPSAPGSTNPENNGGTTGTNAASPTDASSSSTTTTSTTLKK
jgi:preprotein translocase subunit SecG